MRELWIKVNPSLSSEKKKEFIGSTSDFCDTYVVDPTDVKLAREAGVKNIVSFKKGDVLLVNKIEEVLIAKESNKTTCFMATVSSKEDEKNVVKAAEALTDYITINCPDWKVIPLENIIAKIHGKSRLLAWVSDVQEAKLAIEVLEIGVDGVVSDSSDVKEIEKIYIELKGVKTRTSEKEIAERIDLVTLKVVELKPIGTGARVCVDTCDSMKEGEGMLVGCQSSCLFLIQAEVYESPYVNPRPFRVNAGPLAHYILTPGSKTKYLSELRAGDEVLIVNRQGETRITNICRVKIEWRPLILVEALYEGKKNKAILQNAETIRIVTKKGHKSVVELQPGDEVLAHVEKGGRHFGTLVEEERVIER